MRDPVFFERLFPEAGSWSQLMEVCRRDTGPRAKSPAGNGLRKSTDSCFTEMEVKHFNRIFALLGGDKEAQAALAGILNFAQMKDDVAA